MVLQEINQALQRGDVNGVTQGIKSTGAGLGTQAISTKPAGGYGSDRHQVQEQRSLRQGLIAARAMSAVWKS